MAQKKKQLVAEGKLDKHGRPNENTPKEYLRSLPDVTPATKVSHQLIHILAQPRFNRQETAVYTAHCMPEYSHTHTLHYCLDT